MLVVTECAANLLNALDERVFGHDDFWPKGMDQLVLRRNAAAMLDQIQESIEGLWPQAHVLAVAEEARAVGVQREFAEDVEVRSALFHLGPAPIFSVTDSIIGQPAGFSDFSPARRSFFRTWGASSG
jgi:hypothetical protein